MSELYRTQFVTICNTKVLLQRIEISTKEWTIHFWEYVWTGSLIPEKPQQTKRNLLNTRIKSSTNSLRYSACPVTLNGTQVNTQHFTKSAKKGNFNTETKTYFSSHTVMQGLFLKNFLTVYVKLQHIVQEKFIKNV